MAFLSMVYRFPEGSYWRGPAWGAALALRGCGRPSPGVRRREE